MESQIRRRRRPALSCIDCRRRKVKCDRSDPCGQCIAARIRCVYRTYSAPQQPLQPQLQRQPSASTPSVSAPSPSIQVQQLGAHRFTPPLHPSLQGGVTAAAQNDSLIDPRLKDPNHERQPQSLQDLNRLPTPASTAAPSDTSRELLTRQSGVPDSRVILNKTRIVRWSHWMGTAEEVTSAIVARSVSTLLILKSSRSLAHAMQQHTVSTRKHRFKTLRSNHS